jgi:hypothetical protein
LKREAAQAAMRQRDADRKAAKKTEREEREARDAEAAQAIAKMRQEARIQESREYAASMIKSYGWSRARDLAAAEADIHSPTGNRDEFWTHVLTAIEEYKDVSR